MKYRYAVRDVLVLAVFVLAYGALGAVLSLSLTLWMRRKTQKLLKTALFFIYVTVLFFLSGLRYGLTSFAGWDGPGVTLFFAILEKAALSSLIYFLPATLNSVLGRQWTTGRTVWVIVAAVCYLISGIISPFVISSSIPDILTILAFLLIVFFVLADAVRGLPMIQDETTRIALFLLYAVTFLFLPLAEVIPIVAAENANLPFLASSLYHLVLAACASVYFHRVLIRNSDESKYDAVEIFRDSCIRSGLTRREVEIAVLISTGSTYKEMAIELGISPNTVGNHVGTIYRKTGTGSKVDMVNALRKYAEDGE